MLIKKRIIINNQFKIALDQMEHSCDHLFITGRAGTGKSTLLEYFRESTKKKIAVLAPTGIAALNVKGQTIHSFFKFKPDVTLNSVKKLSAGNERAKIYKNLDAIVIDEVSMVRADLLDYVEKFLRLNGKHPGRPFGGIQMIFIGDLYQLPPVITNQEKHLFQEIYPSPYFFSSQCLKDIQLKIIELDKIYRQKDQAFINLLNNIRANSLDDNTLLNINNRLQPNFREADKDFYIHLTTTNQRAEEINYQKLQNLGQNIQTFSGYTIGNFDNKYLPTAVDLSLAVGAQIMMLNNDAQNRWVNGSLGQIVSIKNKPNSETPLNPIIQVKLANDNLVEVTPFTWEIFNFQFDHSSHEIKSETVGSFTQFPMKLAWAITIHKSQGKTFDRVILDIGSGAFASGQVYVALSRCTSLNGLVLKRPILRHHIMTDPEINQFFANN